MASYSEEQIGEMPVWIKNMRQGSDQVSHENNENIDVDTFSEEQELAYKIVGSNFNDISSNKTLLALINGVAGIGKSYLINAIRTVLGPKCAVTATIVKLPSI